VFSNLELVIIFHLQNQAIPARRRDYLHQQMDSGTFPSFKTSATVLYS